LKFVCWQLKQELAIKRFRFTTTTLHEIASGRGCETLLKPDCEAAALTGIIYRS